MGRCGSIGSGYSSPILSGDRILLTAFEEGQLITLSLDRATGQILWRRAVERPREEALDSRNHQAAASAAVDPAGNAYVFFGEFGLVAYDREGVERWRHPLGPCNNVYGMGASPILAEGLVILPWRRSTSRDVRSRSGRGPTPSRRTTPTAMA